MRVFGHYLTVFRESIDPRPQSIQVTAIADPTSIVFDAVRHRRGRVFNMRLGLAYAFMLALCQGSLVEPIAAQTRVMTCVDEQGRKAFVGGTVCPEGSTELAIGMVEETPRATRVKGETNIEDAYRMPPTAAEMAAQRRAIMEKYFPQKKPAQDLPPVPKDSDYVPPRGRALKCRSGDLVWYRVGQSCGKAMWSLPGVRHPATTYDAYGRQLRSEPTRVGVVVEAVEVQEISKSEACRAILGAGRLVRRGSGSDSSRRTCQSTAIG